MIAGNKSTLQPVRVQYDYLLVSTVAKALFCQYLSARNAKEDLALNYDILISEYSL